MTASAKQMLRASAVLLGIVFLAVQFSVSGCQFPVQIVIETNYALASKAPGRLAVEHPMPWPMASPTSVPGSWQPTPAPRGLAAVPFTTIGVAKRPARAMAIAPAQGPPTRIVIPALSLDAPVVAMGWQLNPKTGQPEWQIPANAAGFHRDSALPGWGGNTVLSGHHNIAGRVFAGLWDLKPGDVVELYVATQLYRYRVEDVLIVPERDASDEQRQQNAQWIAPTKDERLTLVTCWPPNDNSHRTIVIARPDWLGQEVSKR